MPDEPAQPEATPTIQPDSPSASDTPAPSDQSDTSEAPNPSPVAVEQEREAILKMIAEGRISPEEGDMLLEALND
jgi:hypothetical protein